MDNPQLNSSINNITLNYHGIKVILWMLPTSIP